MKTFTKEWFINAPWGKIAMVSYGNPNGKPVLLIHGREDSVATFIPLLQLLPDTYNYVGFDMPCHGKSDPFPKGAMLTRFLFVVVVDIVVKYLKWTHFVYLSHSFGGESGLFYNAIYPHRIAKFIHIDISPALQSNMERPWKDFYEKFYANYYDNYDKYNAENRIYSKKQAMEAVMKARGLTEDQADLILSRNLNKIGDDQYRLTWDRRLKIPAPQNITRSFFYQIISKNCPPTLLIQASNTKITYLEGKKESDQLIKDLEGSLRNFYVVTVEGSHDAHVTNPERIAGHVREFLNKEFVSAKI